jgi:uncharacterized cupin superfamily protein
VSDEALDALRVAFVGLLGAERRLRGREGQQAEQLSLAHYRMLTCLLAASDVIDGNPVTRVHHAIQGPGSWDAGFWDCTAGRFRWHFGDAEFVLVLEGEVLVTDGAGVRHHLRTGDMFLFPGRTSWEWEVPEYLHKAFVMHPGPTDRARRRLKGLRRRIGR